MRSLALRRGKRRPCGVLTSGPCSRSQALYENMLVELPFAGFFLSKLLGTSADVDIHHLASLDPEVYRNLLFLKSYEGDVEELGLNFTVVNNDLGLVIVDKSCGVVGAPSRLSFFMCTIFPVAIGSNICRAILC